MASTNLNFLTQAEEGEFGVARGFRKSRRKQDRGETLPTTSQKNEPFLPGQKNEPFLPGRINEPILPGHTVYPAQNKSGVIEFGVILLQKSKASK